MARRFEIGTQWIDVHVDTEGLRGRIKAAAVAATHNVSESIRVNIAAEERGITLLQRKLAAMNDKTVRIRVNVGNDEAMANLDTMMGKMERLTSRFAESTQLLQFGGINSAPLVALGAAAVAASPLLIPLAASITAGAAAGFAAVPAIFGLGLAFAGLKGALSPVGDAMKEYGALQDGVRKGTITAAEANQRTQEILGRLRPSVRGMVVAMIQWKDEIIPGLIAKIQDILFPAITNMLQGLLSSVPIVDRFFADFSTRVAVAIEQMSAFTRTSLFGKQLAVMLDGAARSFGSMASAGVSAFRAIFSIGEAATPVLIRFADWVAAITKTFALWIEMKRRSGELHAFFKMAADEASKWGQIVGNVTMGMFGLFAAALPAGQQLSTSLVIISQNFRSWTVANMDSMMSFFDKLRNINWGSIIGGVAVSQALIVIVHLTVWLVKIWNQVKFLIELFRILAVGGMAASLLTGVGVVLAIVGLTALAYIMDPKFRAIINSSLLSALNMIAASLERNREPLEIVSRGIELLTRTILNVAFMALGFYLSALLTTAGFLISTFIDGIGMVLRLYDSMVRSWFELANVWSATWNAITSFFVMIWGNIGSFWVRAWDNLRSWFGGRLADLVNIWSTVWTNIASFFAFIWANISSFWVRIWDQLRNWFGGRLADLVNIWRITWTAMSNFFGFIWAAIRTVWVAAWNGIRSFVGSTLSRIQGAWNSVWGAIAAFFAIVWNRMATATGAAMEAIRNALFGGLDHIRNTLSNAFHTVSKILESAWKSAKHGAATAWNTVAGLFNGALGALNAVSSLFGFSVDWRFPTISAATGGKIKKFAKGGHVGNKTKGIQHFMFGGAVLGRVWGGGAAQGVSGVYALYHWAGGNGPLSSGFRPGDPLWHGSGLAGDFAGFNQDGPASKLMSVGGNILELIHSTNRANYGISRGHAHNMGGALWAQHKNHLHLAVTPPDASAAMGGKGIPIIGGILSAIGGFFKDLFDLIKDWLNPAKKIWDLMTGGIKVVGFIQGILKALAEKFKDKLLDWIGSLLNPGGGSSAGLVGADGTVIHQAYAQAKSMGASPKVMLALFEAGLVESGLRNLSFGDRDSVGFLQQRPSAGWGSILQIRSVPFATRSFVSRAQRIEGRYSTAGALAQAVQVSAFPGRYAQQRGAAIAAIKREEPGFNPNGFSRGTGAAAPGWHMVGENGIEWMTLHESDAVSYWNFDSDAIKVDRGVLEDLIKLAKYKNMMDQLPQTSRAKIRTVG